MRTIGKTLALAIAVSGIVALSATPVSTQGTATPKFEVVSVKPCAPGDGAGRGVRGQRGGDGGAGTVRTSPGRLSVNCMSVSSMINLYLISSDAERLINDSSRLLDEQDNRRRVRGGPAWVFSERYTINAETNASAAAGREPSVQSLLQGPMLRPLLEDRFQLKTHRDTEQVAVYSLTVAKRGLKIQPMEEGGCVPFDPATNRPRDTPPVPKPWCIQNNGFVESDWTINGAVKR